MTKPPIITTVKPLPFGALSPSEFERLCLWLVEREGYKRPQYLGETGAEQGRDITAYKQTNAGEELWYFQCKRHRRIDAPTLKKEVDKYNELAASYPIRRPIGIIFVTSTSVSAKIRDKVEAYCQEHSYQYDFWTSAELDMYVNKYPEIIEKFFSACYTPAIPALHQLEPPTSDFTGRISELNELITALDKNGTGLCLLQGMGGVGKTALALKLAEQLTARYPDAQIYLDLKGTSSKSLSPADAMRHVLHAFRPEALLTDDEDELTTHYRSVLHGQRILLLLDNASDRWQVEPLIPPIGCMLLITSRQSFHLPGIFTKRLESLPPEDARHLLLKIAPRIDSFADTIAHLCGYLPLALRSSATLLAERVDISAEDYVNRFKDTQQRLEPVASAISLSYDLLDLGLQQLWRCLAVFPALFDVGAAIAVWGIERDSTQDALSELIRYSLVEWYESAGRYRLHDLVHLFAEEQLTETERRRAQGRYAGHYMKVLRMANHLFSKSAEHRWLGISLFDIEWLNIQVGQQWAETNASKDEMAASLCSHYPDAGAHLLHLRVHPIESMRWREAALKAARQLNNHTEEALHLGNLGMDYAAIGQPRHAVELHEQALQISRGIGDRGSEAHDLCHLGMNYLDLGEPDRASELVGQSLIIYREISDRNSEGLALGNLGMIYARIGEFQRAIDNYEEALPIIRETENRSSEGDLLGHLGVLYAQLGETQRAIKLYQSALSISREVGDFRGIAGNMGNLGWALAYAGHQQVAREYHQQQLLASRELGDLQGEGNALHGMGIIFSKAGDEQSAVECFEQALKIFRESGHRYDEANALGDFGSVYSRAKEYHVAIACYEQQLVIAREIRDRRGEASAIWNIGFALSELHNYTEAILKGEEALMHSEELEDWNQTAKIHHYLEQWRKSVEVL